MNSASKRRLQGKALGTTKSKRIRILETTSPTTDINPTSADIGSSANQVEVSPPVSKRGSSTGKNDAIEISKYIVAKKNTEPNYIGNIRRFVEWLLDPENSDEGDEDASFHSLQSNVQAHDNPCYRLILPIGKSILQSYMAHLSKFESGTFKSVKTITGFISALSYVYKLRSTEPPSSNYKTEAKIPDETRQWLSDYVGGFRRTRTQVVSDAEPGVYKDGVGASVIPYSAFREIFQRAMKADRITIASVYHVQYIVMLLNTGARGDTGACILKSNCSVQGDSIGIYFGPTKHDQTAERDHMRRIYANPEDPLLCLFFFTGILMAISGDFWTERMFCGREKLEKSTSSKSRASRAKSTEHSAATAWFSRHTHALQEEEQIQILGCDADNATLHTARKCNFTWLSSHPSGPPTMATAQRVGHDLKALAATYCGHEPGGDALCGRMSCGKSPNDVNIARIWPHFHWSADNPAPHWENLYPNYMRMEDSFQACVPYFTAAVVEQVRNGTIGSIFALNHPFFDCELWQTGSYLKLKAALADPCLLKCESCGLCATGIPGYVMNTIATQKLEDKTEKLFELVKQLFERSGDGTDSATSQLLASIAAKQDALADRLESFLTQDGMQDTGRELSTLSSSSSSSSTVVTSNTSDIVFPHRSLGFYSWTSWAQSGSSGGKERKSVQAKLHITPSNFDCKVCPLHVLWRWWWDGCDNYITEGKVSLSLRIPPLCLIKGQDCMDLASAKRFSKACNCIKYLLAIGSTIKIAMPSQTDPLVHVIEGMVKTLPLFDLSRVFEAIMDTTKDFVDSRRNRDLDYTTFYNNVKALSKDKAADDA